MVWLTVGPFCQLMGPYRPELSNPFWEPGALIDVSADLGI